MVSKKKVLLFCFDSFLLQYPLFFQATLHYSYNLIPTLPSPSLPSPGRFLLLLLLPLPFVATMRNENGARNKAIFVGAMLLLFTMVDYITTPDQVSSLEGAALERSTATLEKRAARLQGILETIAEELAAMPSVESPLTAFGAHLKAAEARTEEDVTSTHDALETLIEENYDKLETWVHTLDSTCGRNSHAGKHAKPIPLHPLGGQGEVFEQAQPDEPANLDTDTINYSAYHAEEEADPCESLSAADKPACQMEEVKAAFLHAWKPYKEHAWGEDELRPITKRKRNWGNEKTGIGLSILDAMTTMHIMGLTEEFEDARKWVKSTMSTEINVRASTFEYTIRGVGALLSAYELSGEKHPEFLDKAKELADKLMNAYETPTGIPHSMVNLVTLEHLNPSWTAGSAVLSEFATVQLELRTLSYHTEKSNYDEKATWIMDILEGKGPEDYLCPTYLSTDAAKWTSTHVTLGALGDSYFEYLLKQYLLTGKTERRYRVMYEKAVKGIVSHMLKKSYPSGQAYVAELKNRDVGGTSNKMDHLACFTGGMFALGVSKMGNPTVENGVPSDDLLSHAEALADTCYLMYKQQPTGIAPEVVFFHGGQDMEASQKTPYYLLRPEAVETFMYLWRLTKKEKYRRYGWEVFRSILRWCKVKGGGFSGLKNVLVVPPEMDDSQQTFWFAETLKYLYLLFADDSVLDLDEWVFNTEGHPLKIRERDPLDVWPTKRKTARKASLVKHIDERVEDHIRKFMEKRAREQE